LETVFGGQKSNIKNNLAEISSVQSMFGSLATKTYFSNTKKEKLNLSAGKMLKNYRP